MKKVFLLLLTALTGLLSLHAEPVYLTVDEAVSLGIDNNYTIKMQSLSAAEKERLKKDAWNIFLPDISASATLSRSNTATTSAGTLIQGSNDGMTFSSDEGLYDYLLLAPYEQSIEPWTLSGNISAQFAFSPAMINGVKQAQLDYRNALLDLESSRQTTELSIRKNFYNLLLLEEQIAVLKKNIQTTEERLESMETMYNYGYITEIDLLKTRAGLASMGPSLLNLENGYKQLLMVFLMDLGLDLTREVVLKGSVEAVPVTWDAEELIDKYLGQRIDLRQLSVQEQMLQNAEKLSINQNLPSLILGWNYIPYQLDPFTGDSWDVDELSGDNGSLSITFSLPLDNWIPHSGDMNSIQQSRNSLEMFRYQKALAILGAEMEVRSLVMELNTSGQNIRVLEESIELNKKSLDMSREAYEKGELQLLELESAENDLLQAELNLVSEKYNYISSLLNLEEAINHELDHGQGSGEQTGVLYEK